MLIDFQSPRCKDSEMLHGWSVSFMTTEPENLQKTSSIQTEGTAMLMTQYTMTMLLSSEKHTQLLVLKVLKRNCISSGTGWRPEAIHQCHKIEDFNPLYPNPCFIPDAAA